MRLKAHSGALDDAILANLLIDGVGFAIFGISAVKNETMSQQERELFKKTVKSYKKKVTASKKASQKFLVELGIFTDKGRLRKEYKNLCIPQDQD